MKRQRSKTKNNVFAAEETVPSTLDLYSREQALIQEKILTLKHQYQDIERSRQDLLSAS